MKELQEDALQIYKNRGRVKALPFLFTSTSIISVCNIDNTQEKAAQKNGYRIGWTPHTYNTPHNTKNKQWSYKCKNKRRTMAIEYSIHTILPTTNQKLRRCKRDSSTITINTNTIISKKNTNITINTLNIAQMQ